MNYLAIFLVLFNAAPLLAQPRGRKGPEAAPSEGVIADLTRQMQGSEIMKSLKDSIEDLTGDNPGHVMSNIQGNVAKLVESIQNGDVSDLDLSNIGNKLNLDKLNLDKLNFDKLNLEGVQSLLSPKPLENIDLQKLGERFDHLDIQNIGGLGDLNQGDISQALGSLRSSFHSIVGEGQGLGMSPDQTADQFLRAASERFSIPELGSFLSFETGDLFADLVREAALVQLPSILGAASPRKLTFLSDPKVSFDKLLSYSTSKGFALGLSPQETVDLFLKEAALTGDYEKFGSLLSNGSPLLGSLAGPFGIQKYADDVVVLLQKNFQFGGSYDPFGFGFTKRFGVGGGGIEGLTGGLEGLTGGFEGLTGGLTGLTGALQGGYLSFPSRYGAPGGYPNGRRLQQDSQSPLVDSAVLDRMISFVGGAGAEPSRIASQFSQYLGAGGRTAEQFLGWASTNPGSLPGSDFGRRVVDELARLPNLLGRRLEKGLSPDIFVKHVERCEKDRKGAQECAKTYLKRQKVSSETEYAELLDAVANAEVPEDSNTDQEFLEEVAAALPVAFDDVSRRGRRLQSFGSILNPATFLSRTLAEIGNEALLEGIPSQLAADRWLAAINSFGLPGGSIQEFLDSGMGNVGFLGEIAEAARSQLQTSVFPGTT